MEDDLDQELLALAEDSSPKPKKRKRTRRQDSASDESDADMDEVKSWGPDLMGDSKDRARLMSLTELERETILAERRRKLDLVNEARELKARLGQKLDKVSRPITKSKKELQKNLAKLKKKRQNKSKRNGEDSESASASDEEEEDESDESDKDEDADAYSQDYTKTENKKISPTATHQDTLKIQIKRTDLEKWAHSPFFESTVKGCFLRIGVGIDPETKKEVYRVVQILNTSVYHRSYKFGKGFVNTVVNVAHGKSIREFYLDCASNNPITTDEWIRYEKTMDYEGQKIVSVDHVNKKVLDIENANNHIFTNDEINKMVEKKKALSKNPTVKAMDKLQLQQALVIAKQENNHDKIIELQEALSIVQEKLKDNKVKDTKLESFTALNTKNRNINFMEGREAEKAAIQEKKKKGSSDYDPFARRKTAPKHVLNHLEEDLQDKKQRKPSPPKKLFSSPLAKPIIVDEDEFLDSIDLDDLEQELK